MEVINKFALNKEEQKFLSMARNVSCGTFSDRGHRIGCVIKCKNGDLFYGATNVRSRTIGSTCAERMALDPPRTMCHSWQASANGLEEKMV